MIIDSSALLAILLEEPEADRFKKAIAGELQRSMSAANFFEAAIIADAKVSLKAGRKLDAFMARAKINIEAVTESQMHIARQAYLDYGRGNHPARLNFGDCFAYALAKETGRPLLYKGGDFAQTDVAAAPDGSL